MIIAEHHRPGTPGYRLSGALTGNVEYVPVCAWPDDCMVQWGHGIVPANPFFEAFPPGTFIRGDGETIEEAERKAFAQYERDLACDHHWGRLRPGPRGVTYTNGVAFCRKCGGFRGSMFSPVFKIGSLRRPISKGERFMLEDDPEMDAHMDAKYPERADGRKKYKRQLQLRASVFGVTDQYFSE